MRKWRVVRGNYRMKYSWKGHNDRNRHKNRIHRSGQAQLDYVKDINHNLLTTWRWAHGDKGQRDRLTNRTERIVHMFACQHFLCFTVTIKKTDRTVCKFVSIICVLQSQKDRIACIFVCQHFLRVTVTASLSGRIKLSMLTVTGDWPFPERRRRSPDLAKHPEVDDTMQCVGVTCR